MLQNYLLTSKLSQTPWKVGRIIVQSHKSTCIIVFWIDQGVQSEQGILFIIITVANTLKKPYYHLHNHKGFRINR